MGGTRKASRPSTFTLRWRRPRPRGSTNRSRGCGRTSWASRPFWSHFYPRLQNHFPGELGAVSLDAFVASINKVEKSLVRGQGPHDSVVSD